jgi:hypothetical protein
VASESFGFVIAFEAKIKKIVTAEAIKAAINAR